MENKNNNLLSYFRYLLAFSITAYYFVFYFNTLINLDSHINWQIQLLPQEVFTFYTPDLNETVDIIYLIDFFLLFGGTLILVKRRFTDIIALIFTLGAVAGLFWRNWLQCKNVDFFESDLISVSLCLITQSFQLNSLLTLLLPFITSSFLIWMIIKNRFYKNLK